MKLNISKTIDENIIGVDISVAELGTSDTDALSTLSPYPVQSVLPAASPHDNAHHKTHRTS